MRDLKASGLWRRGDPQQRDQARSKDRFREIGSFPRRCERLYRTAWELRRRRSSISRLLAVRIIDQSQSLNLFMATPTIGKLSSMYMYAWKKPV